MMLMIWSLGCVNIKLQLYCREADPEFFLNLTNPLWHVNTCWWYNVRTALTCGFEGSSFILFAPRPSVAGRTVVLPTKLEIRSARLVPRWVASQHRDNNNKTKWLMATSLWRRERNSFLRCWCWSEATRQRRAQRCPCLKKLWKSDVATAWSCWHSEHDHDLLDHDLLWNTWNTHRQLLVHL